MGPGLVGRSWFGVPFLGAESYFYRKLLGAVGYFEAGPWQAIDPFRPFKQAELCTDEAEAELTAPDRLALRSVDEQARAILHGSLWGNRADPTADLASGSVSPGSGAVMSAKPSVTSKIKGQGRKGVLTAQQRETWISSGGTVAYGK